MDRGETIAFPPFRLDLAGERLWHGDRAVALRPKTFSVLRYLAERPGRLVSKDELLSALWPDAVVTEVTLSRSIRELREALGDDAHQPRFIETAHGRGFRFIAGERRAIEAPHDPAVGPTGGAEAPSSVMVGRANELERLRAALARARRGARQLVLISGEAGIGKTTLVDCFLASLPQGSVAVGRGQCIEQHGPGDPYLPVFEALGQLRRGRDGDRFAAVLDRVAPDWLHERRERPSSHIAGIPPLAVHRGAHQHMLGVMADVLEAVAAAGPVVLALEDLQWSDRSTGELIAATAQRRTAAPLLLLGTFRPVDAIVSKHPLMRIRGELLRKGHGEEIALELFDEPAVAAYLAARFPTHRLPADLAAAIHRRTDGNPFFVVALLDHLVARGWLVTTEDGWQLAVAPAEAVAAVPDSLRAMIERQLDELDADSLAVAEAASVVGVEFAAQAVAAALERELEEVETSCERLARRGQAFVAQGEAEWPDGSLGARYAFVHALYRQVLYERIPRARRRRLHQRAGERLEAGFKGSDWIAAQLAEHFATGRDWARGLACRQRAARVALGRWAYAEAAEHLGAALALLSRLDDAHPSRAEELGLQIALGEALMNARGWADADGSCAFERARALCRSAAETPQLFIALAGLTSFYHLRGDLGAAFEVSDQMLGLAERMPVSPFAVGAHALRGQIELTRGSFDAAMAHFETAAAVAAGQLPGAAAHLEILARVGLGTALCLLGRTERARQVTAAALARVDELGIPGAAANALHIAAVQHQLRREAQPARACAERALALAGAHGLGHWSGPPAVIRGWALAIEGDAELGVTVARDGLTAHTRTGARAYVSFLATILADACRAAGAGRQGLAAVMEGLELVAATGERFAAAELWRLRGELLLSSRAEQRSKRTSRAHPADSAEAERCYRLALDSAVAQGAHLWALRAGASLAGLLRRQARIDAARGVIGSVLDATPAEVDCAELEAARRLAAELGSGG